MTNPRALTGKAWTIVFVLGLVTACLKPAIKPVVEILDEALEKFESQSYSWQRVLEETRDELIENGQTTVSNEVSNMLNRAISDVGIEARCYTDFLRDRVKEDLIRLRARFTGEKLTLTPVFCNPNPRDVDYKLVQENRIPSVQIDGYNLDVASIRVYLVDSQNQRRDVSSALASPSQYLITLNLGSTGVPLTPQSTKIVFVLSATEERSVNVIQPIPEIETDTLPARAFERLCPTKVGSGDKEFDGHGPDVSASAVLFVKNGRELWVRMSLHVKETRSDWTEARGTWERSIWPGKIGAEIVQFSPSGPSTAAYTDQNHQLDTPSVQGSSLVQKFEILGDTGGNDIGNCTDDDVYMNVYLSEIQVQYVQR